MALFHGSLNLKQRHKFPLKRSTSHTRASQASVPTILQFENMCLDMKWIEMIYEYEKQEPSCQRWPYTLKFHNLECQSVSPPRLPSSIVGASPESHIHVHLLHPPKALKLGLHPQAVLAAKGWICSVHQKTMAFLSGVVIWERQVINACSTLRARKKK